MQKLFIKSIAFLSLLFISGSLTACSKTQAITSSAKSTKLKSKVSQDKLSTKKLPTKITTQSLLKHSQMVMEKAPKFQVVSDTSLQKGETNQHEKITGTYFKKPLNIQLESEKSTNNQTVKVQTFYLNRHKIFGEDNGNWVGKSLDKENLNPDLNLKQLNNVTGLIFNNSLNNFNLTLEGDHYLLQNHTIDQNVTSQLSQLLAVNNYQGESTFAAKLNQYKVTDFSYEAHFERKTLAPQRITYAISLIDANQENIQLNGSLIYNLSLKQKRFMMPK